MKTTPLKQAVKVAALAFFVSLLIGFALISFGVQIYNMGFLCVFIAFVAGLIGWLNRKFLELRSEYKQAIYSLEDKINVLETELKNLREKNPKT